MLDQNAGAEKPVGRRPRGRGQDAGPAVEQVRPGVGHTPPLRTGDRMRAHVDRRAARLTLHGLDDLPLGAAGVGDQHLGAGGFGTSADVLDHPVDRRADDHRLGRRQAIAEVGRTPVDRARFTASPNVPSCRPTPMTSDARPRERNASPIDPPIKPTPKIVTVPNGSKTRTSIPSSGVLALPRQHYECPLAVTRMISLHPWRAKVETSADTSTEGRPRRIPLAGTDPRPPPRPVAGGGIRT